MSPKKKNLENQGLPERWRFRYGSYYYQVPPGMECAWDGKKEFRLGKSLSEAYKIYADKITPSNEIQTMRELFNRYRLEVIPKKAEATQIKHTQELIKLELILGDNHATLITTQDCYKILDSMTEKRGATTANDHIGLLSHVFTMAIRWGVINNHPIKGKLVKNKLTPQRYVPTRDEIEKALTVASPMLNAYVRFKILTGLRQADILTLRLNCIKDDGLHITPRKTQSSSGKSIIIQWDNDGELNDAIIRIKALRRPIGSIFLFCNRKGEPYFKAGSASGFKSIWQRWMTKAINETELKERFTERSLRTFVGSEFDTAEEAARLLTHTNVKTTQKHYRERAEKVFPLTAQKRIL